MLWDPDAKKMPLKNWFMTSKNNYIMMCYVDDIQLFGLKPKDSLLLKLLVID